MPRGSITIYTPVIPRGCDNRKGFYINELMTQDTRIVYHPLATIGVTEVKVELVARNPRTFM
jgi:hypothetical protein